MSFDENKYFESKFGSSTDKEWCVLETTTPEHPEKFDRSFDATNGGKWYIRAFGTQVMVWMDQDKKPGYAVSLPGKHLTEAPYEFTPAELICFWFNLMDLMQQVDKDRYPIKDFSTNFDLSKVREILGKFDWENFKKQL